MERPILAITMGDPAGVGPEITMRALADATVRDSCRPVLIGRADVFEEAAALVGSSTSVRALDGVAGWAWRSGEVPVVEPEGMPRGPLARGEVDATCGQAAFACIAEAARLVLAGQADAMVTNPIHKKAIRQAGHLQPGHTEILRELTGAPSSAMMLVEGELRVVHVSTHCALREAAERCRTPRILEVTRLADAALRRLGIDGPRLAMSALNPHAGDGGLFGDEEAEQIAPAVAAARAEGIDVSDPLPGDTVFSLAAGGGYDAVIAQYHDQGHIPVKLLGFRYDANGGGYSSVSGINVTLGLPILRASVDHGTAFDVAWTGQASCESLIRAVDFAVRWCAGGGR
jgi:4-hydroxythreonine-4-phosphate dehydrogenase